MTKVFNITFSVVVSGKNRSEIVSTLNQVRDDVSVAAESICESTVPIVDGYWDSEEAYNNGEDCHDDDTWSD